MYAFLVFAVHFVRTFERLTKTFQILKMIHSGYSKSYFNLFLIYVVCDAYKYTFTNIKTVVIVQKIDLTLGYKL